jgi:hypothetical protein
MEEEFDTEGNISDSNESYISLKSLKSAKDEQLRVISLSAWSCCGEIICNCGDEFNDQPTPPDFNSDNENDDGNDPRCHTQVYNLNLTELNNKENSKQTNNKNVTFYLNEIEPYTPEETPYQENIQQENENGWGHEYYQEQRLQTTWEDFPEDTSNDDWPLPNQETEQEDTIYTTAWIYSRQEIQTINSNLIKERWVIANQPINQGKMQCHGFCDIENHHLHKWCTICQIKDDHNTHQCRFGFKNDENQLGKVHPDMDPAALVNDVFWSEPENVLEQDQQVREHVSMRMNQYFYKKDKDTNKRTQETQTQYHNDKRYKGMARNDVI